MEKLKLYSIIFLVLYWMSPAFAQIPNEEQRFATINIPSVPSPNAASLGQYANYPVENFTGSPAINVPLYQLTVGDYKLPISLSYNPTGVKVGDVSSWVGMGWSLNCGGVITRNVMDIPDDKNDAIYGWLHYNYIVGANSWDNGRRTIGYSPQGGQKNVIGLAGMRSTGFTVDSEPDIFYYNFNGHAGKFVFSQGSDTLNHTGQIPAENHEINLIPYKDLKFSYTLTNDDPPHQSSTLGTFSVVDETGNQYYFEKAEWTSSRIEWNDFFPPPLISSNYAAGYAVTQGYKSSWYLTRIITIQNKVINFNYVEENFTQVLPESYSVRNFESNIPYIANIDCSKNYDYYNSSRRITTNQIKGQRLSSIESSNFKITFDAEHQRQDLAAASALTAVSIYSKNETGILSFIKKINLNYGYIQSAIDPVLDQTVNNKNTTTYGDPNKRLRLDQITEADEAGNLLPPYVFEYNTDYTLPSRFSPHQDFWGYFNNNSCNTLIPTLYIYPGEFGNDRFSLYRKTEYSGTDEFVINGADRTASPAASLAGTLKKITYPLGGYEEFTFGTNEFILNGQNIIGGGLRLEKSTRYDGVNHANDIIKEYSYRKTSDNTKSSGVLFNLPIFTYVENFLPYWNPSNQDQVWPRPGGEFDPETFGYFKSNLVITSAPNYTLSGYDGVNVGYSEITEKSPGNGYIVSRYSTPGQAQVNNDVLNDGCTIAENGYCDGLFKTAPVEVYWFLENCPDGSPALNDQMIDQTGLHLNSNGFPFAPKTNYEWNRGLLLSQKIYSNESRLIKEINQDYLSYTPQKKWPHYVYGLRKGRMSNYKPYTSTCWGPTYGLYRFDVVVNYPIITNITKMLARITVKEYNMTNNETLTTVTNNLYNGNQLKESVVARSTSKNENTVTEFKYPNDFPAVSPVDALSNGVINLRSQHVIAPIEVSNYVSDVNGGNKRLVSASILAYNSVKPLVDSVMQTEIVEPVTDFISSSATGSGFVKDSRYHSKIIADRYDQSGNLLENHLEGNPKTSYLWSYDSQYIIAEIKNAEYSVVENLLGGPTAVSNLSSSNPSDDQVNTIVALLRNSPLLKGAQITSYTYKPLIGVTSITDPKGMVLKYEYDTYQRLRAVKDLDGNIIKQYDYHFKQP